MWPLDIANIAKQQQKTWRLFREITINTFASTIGFLAALPAYYVTIKKQAPGSTETYGEIIREGMTKHGRKNIYTVLNPAIRASATSSFSSWGVMLTLSEINKDKDIAQRALISGVASSTIESYFTYRSLWSMTNQWSGNSSARQQSNLYAARVFRATLAKNFISNPVTMFALLKAQEQASSSPANSLARKHPLLLNIITIALIQPFLAPLNTLQTHAQFDPSKTMQTHFTDICRESPFRLFRGCTSRAVFQGGKLGVLTFIASKINTLTNNQQVKRNNSMI